jgi:hypothetical protein
MFVRPNGEQLADAVVGDEGLVVAEIDMPNRPLWIRNPRCRDEQLPDESTQSPQESILRSCPQLREAFPYDTQRKCMTKVREGTPGRRGGRSAQLSIQLLGDNDSAEFFIGTIHGGDMHWIPRALLCCTAILSAFSLSTITSAQTNPFTKGQVADRIRKVEDGVDEFQKYLNNRGDDAKNRADSAQNSGASSRRQRGDSTNAQNRRDQAKQTKDDLEDAMDDLNRSTNRLRRKFDPTSNYLETKVQMEQVMDSARRVNQVMTKGNYGTQAERYWAALRANINDLARCYNLTPMGT